MTRPSLLASLALLAACADASPPDARAAALPTAAIYGAYPVAPEIGLQANGHGWLVRDHGVNCARIDPDGDGQKSLALGASPMADAGDQEVWLDVEVDSTADTGSFVGAQIQSFVYFNELASPMQWDHADPCTIHFRASATVDLREGEFACVVREDNTRAVRVSGHFVCRYWAL